MNFSDEEYVRLYVTDTVTWDMLGWEGNALMVLALRKFDRSGVFEFGRHGAERALCSKTKLPIEFVRAGLEALLREEVWVLDGDRIFWPKYVDAQTCKRSDRLRQRMARARRVGEPDVTPESERDTSSHSVTDSHEITNVSQTVTLGEARRGEGLGSGSGSLPEESPERNQPVRPTLTAAERQERSFRAADPAGLALFKAWQAETGKTGADYDWKRRELFERIASEGVTVEVVREVVAGAKLDRWARDSQKLAPASILGSAEQREKFVDLRRNPPRDDKPAGDRTGAISEPRLNSRDLAAAFDLGPRSRSGAPTGTDARASPKTRPGATSTDLVIGKVG